MSSPIIDVQHQETKFRQQMHASASFWERSILGSWVLIQIIQEPSTRTSGEAPQQRSTPSEPSHKGKETEALAVKILLASFPKRVDEGEDQNLPTSFEAPHDLNLLLAQVSPVVL